MAADMENNAGTLLDAPVEAQRKHRAGSRERAGSFAYRLVKRGFDFGFSLAASLILLIPMAVVALLIVIKDPGNPFFVQTRVGQNGKPIRLLKFRSMKMGADCLEEVLTPEQLAEYKREFKLKDDPRLIGWKKPGDAGKCFGSKIRTMSIDEMPQILYNVCLRGDMSLVGPRPILQEELEKYYTPQERELLLSVKPGITGLWQTQGRNDCTYEDGERQKVELEYAKRKSIVLDLKILFKTVRVVLDAGGGILTKRHRESLSRKAESESLAKRKPVYAAVKRGFDILVSLLCLSVGLPVYLLIALAIVIDDPGNPFFLQKRIGLHGKAFTIVKFRTMYQDAEQRKSNLMTHNEYESVHFKMTDDPRITRVGKFLRKTSLDEAPQAINLLTGSMSVIGPRPFIPEEQAQLPLDRLCVKPGLSCYWQITDTTKMSYEDQLELDYKYIRERSVWADLKLIGLTVKVVFKGGNY